MLLLFTLMPPFLFLVIALLFLMMTPPSLCYYAFDLLTTVVAMLGMSIILDFHE